MHNEKTNKASRYENYITVIRAIGEVVKKYSTKNLSDEYRQMPGEIFLIALPHCLERDIKEGESIKNWINYRQKNDRLAKKIKKRIKEGDFDGADYIKLVSEIINTAKPEPEPEFQYFWDNLMDILRNNGMQTDNFLNTLFKHLSRNSGVCVSSSWVIGWVAEELPYPK